jgi:hypothetical protein
MTNKTNTEIPAEKQDGELTLDELKLACGGWGAVFMGIEAAVNKFGQWSTNPSTGGPSPDDDSLNGGNILL